MPKQALSRELPPWRLFNAPTDCRTCRDKLPASEICPGVCSGIRTGTRPCLSAAAARASDYALASEWLLV
jgi:hypothetical protein